MAVETVTLTGFIYVVFITALYALYDYMQNNSNPSWDMILSVGLVGIGLGVYCVVNGIEVTPQSIASLLTVSLIIIGVVDRGVMQIYYYIYPAKQQAKLQRKLAKVRARITAAAAVPPQ